MPESKKELPPGFYTDPIELSEITFEISEFNQICAYKDGFLFGIVQTVEEISIVMSINGEDQNDRMELEKAIEQLNFVLIPSHFNIVCYECDKMKTDIYHGKENGFYLCGSCLIDKAKAIKETD